MAFKTNEFGIWSSFDVELTPEDMVLQVKKRGLRVCELSDEHAAVLLERKGDPSVIGKQFGDFAASHGISFPQGHLWLRIRLCDKNIDSIEELKKWLRLFGGIGIKNAVLHCDEVSFNEKCTKEEIISANAERLKLLIPTAEECGVRICLENLCGVFSGVDDLLAVIEATGSSSVGICLDTGHLNISRAGMSQKEFILKAGDKLHALHIADNEGERDQHMMPLGRGKINWRSVMEGLSEIGYSDCFNYEIPGERYCPISVRDAKAEYLKTVTEYLFSLAER